MLTKFEAIENLSYLPFVRLKMWTEEVRHGAKIHFDRRNWN